ncbi:lymphatic vessel endothelial hyaluronic receptor 1b [Odontesthes bonariensis]|uniref:lymphatic vessel endothelial hyaluronic receptor 1b n=1 Tax=Odontesthes bonariensis TaxID=219752 RepID=UPI003F586605
MAGLCWFTQCLFLIFQAFVHPSESGHVKVVSESQKSTGVFMLIEGGKYTFNFADAKEACQFLNVTIATRAQVEKAQQRGLETCKFGWVADRIAVVPRLMSDKNCGQGKTGVVPWYAPMHKKFGVFCFNSSALADLDETLETSTTDTLQASTSSTLRTSLTQTSTPAVPLVRSTFEYPSSTKMQITSKAPKQTSVTSNFVPSVETTLWAWISSSASPSLTPIHTHTTVSPPHHITSNPTVDSSDFSTSAQASTFSVSPEPALTKGVYTALISVGIVLLLLMSAGALLHHKLRRKTSGWCHRQQKDDIETEMWKHSEMDLHGEHGVEEDHDEEEPDQKYSSDIMLCKKPHIKANSSE